MMGARRTVSSAAAAGMAGAVLGAGLTVLYACGPDIVFRAYLSKTFWQPAVKYVSDLVASLPADRADYRPYAGMTLAGGSPSLQDLRDGYRALFPDIQNGDRPPLDWPEETIARLSAAASTARAATPSEVDELDLLRCKIKLRAVKRDDKPGLAQVYECFDRYLAQPRPPALVSEARGWRARVDFLDHKDARAAKFYLDELASPTTNIRRDRLLESLDVIRPSLDELDQYFDTPGHALFLADRVTSLQSLEPLVGPLIERLRQHRDLFGQGTDSDALAVAMMRASTRLGAPEETLRYAEQVRQGAPARLTADYNWMVGAAQAQQKALAPAAAAFKRTIAAKDADAQRLTLAANGLISVYARLHRPVDQLWAAFQLAAATDQWSFDAAYLLDVQMTEAELEAYIARYAQAPDVVFQKYPAKQSALHAVRYALAVRHARREDYAGAARLFEALQTPRADRMKRAATLLTETRAPQASAERQLEGRYAYASFLADNENGIFFNDKLWHGLQTWAFVYRHPDLRTSSWTPNRADLSDSEVAALSSRERLVRDRQEEYWRAYQILNDVVSAAGHTPIGKRAAARGLSCLRQINIDRFGRGAEIRAADLRLTRWLAKG